MQSVIIEIVLNDRRAYIRVGNIEKERKSVYVCVCVYAREREKERENGSVK